MTVDKNILSILENLIPFPTFILDDEGRIIDFNQKGKKFLPDATFNTSIFEILDKEFASVLERLLYEAKNYDKGVKENILTAKKENSDEYEISVTPFNDDVQKTFITTIRLIADRRSSKELQKFTIVTEEIDKLIKDEELFEIIKSVKSAYPFTFIGKAKIQKQIDMLDGFFWIKDNSRRFIIVNQKLASVLGVKAKQLEGRFEKDILPHFQNKLYSTIDNYIFETTNSVIIDDISSTSPYGNDPYEIVEFPILDIDNNVVAIIGVSQYSYKIKEGTSAEKFDVNLIKELNLPYLLTNKEGMVQSYNDSVRKYLYDTSDVSNKHIVDIFSTTEIKDELHKFLENEKTAKTSLKVTKDSELFCIRNYTNKGKTSQLLFVFDDSSKIDSQTAGIIKMYDAIMKISPQAMFIYDLENLKFLEINDAAIKLYGYSKEEFLNMDLTDLYAPEDIQTLLQTANKKNQTNEFTGPWRHKKKDGSSIIVELSNSPLEYKGKSAHINIVKNVTEEVKNNKKIKLFRTAFDNSSDIIFITDKDGFITYANEAVIRTLGYSKSDLEKKPFLSLLKDENRAEFNKTIIHSDSKEQKKYKTEIKKSSGENIETSLVATPIYEFTGELESISIVGKVKSQTIVRTETDAERKENKGIEPSFLSNVFHELLTPINVILGFIQEINDGLENPSEEQKEAIDIIKENQKILLQTMDTAAEYSAFVDNKIKLKPQEITFVDLLEEIQSTTERTAKSNNIELTYGKISSSLKLTTDKHHFTILITQFLKYAMQISKENKIYLSAYTYDKGKCFISIKDKREGITPHLLNGLKDIFTKDEDSIRKSLGFSRITTKLFKKLIDSLDARNEVINKNDKSVEFGLVFPEVLEVKASDEVKDDFAVAAKEREEHLRKTAVEEKVEEPKPPVKEEPAEESKEVKDVNINVNVTPPTTVKKETPKEEPKPRPTPPPVEEIPKKPEPRTEKKPVDLSILKCLYVEDQVDSQILFKVQMKELEDIDFAKSFEEALPKIKSKDFDFIVLDINLEGEYNGLDALRVIQKLPGYHNKPIIAVTAYVLPGDRDKFIAAGFSDFISKPVLKDKLVDALEKIF